MSAWLSSKSIIDKLIGEENKPSETAEESNNSDEENSSPLAVMQMTLKTDDTIATPVPEEEKNP